MLQIGKVAVCWAVGANALSCHIMATLLPCHLEAPSHLNAKSCGALPSGQRVTKEDTAEG